MLKPIGSRVIIEVVAPEEVTGSGIIIPEAAKDVPTEGVVVAIGEGRVLENGMRVPVDVQVGDRIIFSKYAAKEVAHEGKVYVIVHEKDILVVV